MSTSRSREGHRFLQVGVTLLIFSSLEGFAIPYITAPRLGLSVHTLSALQGVLLLVVGLAWTKLNLSATSSRAAFWLLRNSRTTDSLRAAKPGEFLFRLMPPFAACALLTYSAFAILAAYVMAAIWGAGNETMPLAAGSAHGSAVQETVIKIVAYSSAPTGLMSFGLILWGLRFNETVERR